MKTALVLSCSLLTCSVGFAQGRPDNREGPRFQDIELVETFDADGDGRLDRTERDAAREMLASQPEQPRRRRPGGPEVAEGPRPHTKPDALRMNNDTVEHYPDSGLYDTDALHTLFFEFDDDDWHEELTAFHGSDVEVPARLIIDGETIGEVGVTYRGNTSFDHPVKKSFGVSIDAYDDDLRLKGYRTLNLLNANGDTSLMREVLFSNIAREYMPAPRANFVKVVVNGAYLGIYGNVQQINKDFTEENYDSKKGVRWKVPPDFSGGGSLAYLGEDIDEYRNGYELKTGSATDEDWEALLEVCRVLRETPDEELETTLPKYMDVDEIIWFLALDNVFMDSDGYYSRGSDYYVYKDPDGIFHLLHYDNNETFGGGRRPPGGGPGGPPPGGPGGLGGPPPGEPGGPGGPPPGGPGGPGAPPPGGPGGGPPFGPEFEPDPDVRSRPGLDRPRRGGRRNRSNSDGAPPPPPDGRRFSDDGGPQDGRGRGRGRGGRRGRGGGGGGGVTQPPLAFADAADTRPVIARILAVDAWRELYLARVRQLALVELEWEQMNKHIEPWRDLIGEDLALDPFHEGSEAFQRSLDGPDNSLKSIAAQRRAFLLQPDDPEKKPPTE